MSNFLRNGAVLPHGLLTHNNRDLMAGFNKSYRAYPLRLGVILHSYPVTDDNNRSKLTSEYDVSVFEQNENNSATTIIYKNCMASEGLGSIADYFEKSLRYLQKNSDPGIGVPMKGQDGAIVLILCLDAMSDKAIIISSLTHPDRVTNIQTDGPVLYGEYNGINIKINEDGSTSLTFKGPTNNDGSLITPDAGPTEARIEIDGSFQIQHSTILFRLDKDGVATLTAKSDVDITCANVNVKADGDVNVTATGDINAQCVNANMTMSGDTKITTSGNTTIKTTGDTDIISDGNINATASGTATVEAPLIKLGKDAAESVIKGDTFKSMVFDTHIHPTPIGPSGPPTVPMAPSSLSTKVKTE